MRVFVSHSQSQEDANSYFKLCTAIERAGISRWDPSSLAHGASLSDQLRNAINDCDMCVFLATKNSIKSRWCLAELGAFWGMNKRVIMYIGDRKIKKSKLPKQFAGHKFTRDRAKVVRELTKTYDQLTKIYDLVLVTEWHLAGGHFREQLLLRETGKMSISGNRKTTKSDGQTKTYRVTGHFRDGIYWLAYHSAKRRGGGAFILSHQGGDTWKGAVLSANCYDRKLLLRTNTWIAEDSESRYDSTWLTVDEDLDQLPEKL